MPTNRFGGAAAVSRNGCKAGTIDSSSGKARVTPAPRRNVRRGMQVFVMNMLTPSRSLDAHPELRASDNPEDDRREPVLILVGRAREGVGGGGVPGMFPTPRAPRSTGAGGIFCETGRARNLPPRRGPRR